MRYLRRWGWKPASAFEFVYKTTASTHGGLVRLVLLVWALVLSEVCSGRKLESVCPLVRPPWCVVGRSFIYYCKWCVWSHWGLLQQYLLLSRRWGDQHFGHTHPCYWGVSYGPIRFKARNNWHSCQNLFICTRWTVPIHQSYRSIDAPIYVLLQWVAERDRRPTIIKVPEQQMLAQLDALIVLIIFVRAKRINREINTE